jgi:hypothetical protein
MEYLTKEEAKQAVKEALNEWLDKQWIRFGKWTAGGFLSLAIVVFAWLYQKAHGVMFK